MDTKNRVATLIFSPEGKLLVGHAPNRPLGDNQWDIVGKGHIDSTDNPLETCIREVWEESGISIKNSSDLNFQGVVKYQNGSMYIYTLFLEENVDELKCNSFFDWYGKQLPEFSEFMWIDLVDAKQYLYKVLYKAISEKLNFTD